jgi:hypothetical protein
VLTSCKAGSSPSFTDVSFRMSSSTISKHMRSNAQIRLLQQSKMVAAHSGPCMDSNQPHESLVFTI